MSDAPSALSPDPFHLARFLTAQEDESIGSTYATALAELRAGAKRTHWMWYIFPQAAGLGSSPTSVHFAIKSRAEAKAWLAHPVLGSRLRECTAALLQVPPPKTAEAILGSIDAQKLQSSLTLFAAISHGDTRDETRALCEAALARFFEGERDPRTLAFLAAFR